MAWSRGTPLVVAAGAAAGLLGRHLPVDLAILLVRRDLPGCGDRSILECALDNVDDLVGALLRFVVALVAICVVAAAVGGIVLAVGLVRRRAWLVAAGVAVLLPAVWQAASLASHLLAG